MHDALRKFELVRFAVLALLLALAPLARAAPYAYVTNQVDGTVSVIDTANNTVVATIAVGDTPQGAAVSPDGGRVYVANLCVIDYCGAGTVSVIDTTADQVIDTIAPQAYPFPYGVAVSPDGARVYVTHDTSNGAVSVINSANNTVVATVSVGYGPSGVAVSPDGNRVYVANQCAKGGDCGHGTLSVIAIPSDEVIDTIALGLVSAGVAVSPDGSRVYVTNEYGGSVSVIDTATDHVVATVPVGDFPLGVAVSPNGSRIYVANWGVDTVSVIDAATDQVIDTITTGSYPAYPADVAFSPDGTRVYAVNNGSDTVAVIDTATNQVIGTVPVGRGPIPIGPFVGPGALIASNSEAVGPAGTQVSGSLPALANSTTCSTTDGVVEEPSHGQLNVSAGGGEFTYTPDSATYSGPDVFTWRGEAPASCTAADSPTDPASNTATVLLTLNPVITGLGSVTLKENQSARESFSLAGSSPFTLTPASSNPTLLPTSGLTLNPANCGADDTQLMCTLAIAPVTDMTGVATVTLRAIDAHGDSTQEQFTVTVKSSGGSSGGGSGGGGASTPLGLIVLAAFLALAGLHRRGLHRER